ncbi:MAG: alpha/beta hydrolase [Rhodospirillales bacterium]|nr:alpha/beta hydrolase [Rhodospirillales bacterium]
MFASILAAFLVLAGTIFPAAAQDLADRKIGLVLIHGKWGGPNSRGLYDLDRALAGAGVLVEKPEMPWSRNRNYDAGYDDAMKDIDKAVEKLKAKGASRIVVGGHSYGANAGLGYGATRDGLAGVLALAPGHNSGNWRTPPSIRESVAAAKQLLAAGQGGESFAFTDFNEGKQEAKRATVKIFLSHFDPMGPAAMDLNAAKIRPNTPILWVIAHGDLLFALGRTGIYDKAPAHPKSRYVEVDGGHMETPSNSVASVLDWLKTITD